MKFGVVVFPGSNCDEDMVYVLRHKLRQRVVKLWHKDHSLQDCDFVILPGGFSYGDYLRSGAIARFSPIMQEVVAFAKRGGYVFGVCNGFQILCEAHLLPGALLANPDHRFVCKNVFVRAEHSDSMITSLAADRILKIPVAHGEGNFYTDPDTLREMHDRQQILFRYCDSEGNRSSASNPNGSLENIAGICNEGKNVFGMMPHPERAVDNNLSNTDGRIIFESLFNLVQA